MSSEEGLYIGITNGSTSQYIKCYPDLGTSSSGRGMEYKPITDVSLPNYVLKKNNTEAYTPTANYHPSTKKYVDDAIKTLGLDIPDLIKNAKVYLGGSIKNLDPGIYISSSRYTSSGINGMGAIEKNSIIFKPDSLRNYAIALSNDTNGIKLGIIYNKNNSESSKRIDLQDLLPYNNTEQFAPWNDYNLVHKKYVDDKIAILEERIAKLEGIAQ